jgi:outer membrane protein OmpA-like peptidoglycan-associated protein
MRIGTLSTCTVGLFHAGRLLAGGQARSAGSGGLTVRPRLTAYGRRLLARRLGGVSVRVRAVAGTTGGVRRAHARTRALLRVERFRTAPGSFVANRPVVTPRGKRLLRSLRGKLVAVRSLRCDGYAASARPRSVVARSLSRRRARVLCAALGRLVAGRLRVRVIGHGAARPIASNASRVGRAINRRVEVTVVHRR